MTGRRGVVVWVVLVVVVLAVAATLTSGARSSGVAYDPTSTGADGTRALVELLETYDADVVVPTTLDLRDVDVAVVFRDPNVVIGDEAPDPDALTPDEQLRRFAEEGGTVVVADPYSSLAPPPVDGVDPGSDIEPGDCGLRALDGVPALRSGGYAARYEVPPGALGCFGEDGASFVVSQGEGAGRIVAIGDPTPFTNRYLGDGGNAQLAVTLLAPTDGTRVAVLPRQVFLSAGDVCEPFDTNCLVAGVLGAGGRLAVLQCALALLVYGWARARRVGKPVAEPQPVDIAAAELVAASGELLSQTATSAEAATVLRADARTELGRRFGLPADAAPEVLIATVADRTGLDPVAVAAALGDRTVATDAELVALGAQIDHLRQEVLHEYAR